MLFFFPGCIAIIRVQKLTEGKKNCWADLRVSNERESSNDLCLSMKPSSKCLCIDL